MFAFKQICIKALESTNQTVLNDKTLGLRDRKTNTCHMRSICTIFYAFHNDHHQTPIYNLFA